MREAGWNGSDLGMAVLAIGAFAAGYGIISALIRRARSNMFAGRVADAPAEAPPVPTLPGGAGLARDRAAPADASAGLAARHAAVLGLREPFTRSELQRRYAELCARHGSAAAESMGPGPKEAAAVKMRAIHEAYDYFRRAMGPL